MLSTDRMIADGHASALKGRVHWAPAKSLWIGGMTAAALVLGPVTATPGAVLLWLLISAATLCLGHSIGLHRLLIHRSLSAGPWVTRWLAWMGTLVGMAGPLGMVGLHDTRDWAQRQRVCHPYHAHRAPMWLDYWWQVHCRLHHARPPVFRPEAELDDPWLRLLERTWMLQQLPLALLFWWIGGLPWLVWGVAVRVAVGVTGHWFVGHVTHRRGPQGWRVEGAAVQGHDWPAAAWITFGEAWHGNHHAWPGSARLGVEPGQADPGWWALVAMRRLGLVDGLREPGDLSPRDGLVRTVSR